MLNICKRAIKLSNFSGFFERLQKTNKTTKKKFWGFKKASSYYELIIKTLVFMTLIATAISFFNIFTIYLNLNYTCRRVVREIEIAGQYSSSTDALFNTMKANTNIGSGASMTVNASYFNAAQKTIQLRDTFTVTCRTSYRFNIFTPLGSTPVGLDIPMTVRLTGMSEKYWKIGG